MHSRTRQSRSRDRRDRQTGVQLVTQAVWKTRSAYYCGVSCTRVSVQQAILSCFFNRVFSRGWRGLRDGRRFADSRSSRSICSGHPRNPRHPRSLLFGCGFAARLLWLIPSPFDLNKTGSERERFRSALNLSRSVEPSCHPIRRQQLEGPTPCTIWRTTCRYAATRNPERGVYESSKRSIAEFWERSGWWFGGCGSAVLAASFPNVGIGLLGVSLAFGLTS